MHHQRVKGAEGGEGEPRLGSHGFKKKPREEKIWRMPKKSNVDTAMTGERRAQQSEDCCIRDWAGFIKCSEGYYRGQGLGVYIKRRIILVRSWKGTKCAGESMKARGKTN